MKKYYRMMLGKGSVFARECRENNYIGITGFNFELPGKLPDNWRDFNKEFIPVFMKLYPEKSKIAAGLFCATHWMVACGFRDGDVLLCPDGAGNYLLAELAGPYRYNPEVSLPHSRPVRWLTATIQRAAMSEALQNSSGAIATYCDISKHGEEIEKLISGKLPPGIFSNDETIEDPSVFALEKHLEDFLIQNWSSTELGKLYDVYQEDKELVGQQFPTDTGNIDILAISKDKSKLVVIELKKGRASDYVLGQIQRYMGYVKDELAEPNQTVHGIIIALEDDLRLKRALSVAVGVDFYRYQVDFKLFKS